MPATRAAEDTRGCLSTIACFKYLSMFINIEVSVMVHSTRIELARYRSFAEFMSCKRARRERHYIGHSKHIEQHMRHVLGVEKWNHRELIFHSTIQSSLSILSTPHITPILLYLIAQTQPTSIHSSLTWLLNHLALVYFTFVSVDVTMMTQSVSGLSSLITRYISLEDRIQGLEFSVWRLELVDDEAHQPQARLLW